MPQATRQFGKLFLVPAPLDFGCDEDIDLKQVMPIGTLCAAANITHWICENAKTTRAYLKRIDACTPLKVSIQTQTIVELPRQVHKKGDHLGGFDAKPLLAPALEGQDLGIQVIPLVGPVSLLLALASSGLNGQNFAFVGYLPQDPQDRARRIKELEQIALKSGQTQLFIETPYRNAALWSSLIQTLLPGSRIAFSSGLTLTNAVNQSGTAQQWRKLPSGKMPEGLNNQTPAVFAIGI